MVDKSKDDSFKVADRSREDTSITRSSEIGDFYDSIRENFIKIADEMAKVQPQYSQSISNLQLDYIQAIKNTIHTSISAQKHLTDSNPGTWNSGPSTTHFTEQFRKQSNEITNNTIRAVGINNQLTINALDATRENLKIYNKTIDAVTEFNSNAAKAWNLFFSTQQQQFYGH
jgi:acetyl/propionyl-CoA carboxylase alpha subunit